MAAATTRCEKQGGQMKIEGYDDHEIAAICEQWKLGAPIDVNAFFERADIPEEVKNRIVQAQPLGAC
jgi:hypothetical protein